jgi:hypothetical protein
MEAKTMDAALSLRATHPQTTAQAPRAEAMPVREAVPTVLPQPDQSVPATARYSALDGAAARPPREQKLSDETLREIEREFEFNEETNDLVSRTLDLKTGQVLAQFPAETLLKLRAYVRASADSAESAAPLVVRTS